MGKVKHHKGLPRAVPGKNDSKLSKNVQRRQHSQNIKVNPQTKAVKIGNQNAPQQRKPRIPFGKYDQVLLIGEGDFSFALSLARNHDVGSIVASSYDDKETLQEKYPRIQETLHKLLTSRELREDSSDPSGNEAEAEWVGFSSDDEDADPSQLTSSSSQITVLHGVNATLLSTAHKKLFNAHVPFTKIVFNFPHTGGLSTDVNRQVRANQELLVGFFNAAKPLLATRKRPATSIENENEYADEADVEKIEEAEELKVASLATGHILVTLFEGEPYSLWNIRDLARHCGLQVIESFKFPWSSYPGYTHARTIGDIKTGKDRSEQGQRKGAWRGEEREARCFILTLKEEAPAPGKGKRKRELGNDSGDSD